jgi:glyoxylase-like metal-dependent hydrolase (beta-lactamase superfamily II)
MIPHIHPSRRALFHRLVWVAFVSGGMPRTIGGEPALERLQPTRTEEGQLVAFNRGTYQARELSKVLPLDLPWPVGPELAKTIARLGLNKNPPPAMQPMPARILGDVFLVGQAHRSTNLTYMIDCGPEGVALIDPSYDSEFDRTVENIEKCGRARKDIRWVINTHCHTDHSWADHQFSDLGAQIVIHEADAAAIEKGTRVTAFDRYDLKHFPLTRVDRRLSDGEELRLGNKIFQIIHTPGHTPGSMCLLLQIESKNVLFSGDTVFYDSMLGLQGLPYSENDRYLKSVAKLEVFKLNAVPVRWDLLLPGHGTMVLERAYLDVQKARERIEHDLMLGRELLVPPHPALEYRRKMFGRPATPFGRVAD